MYSTHNEVKSVVAERFIRTFRKQDLQAYNCNIKKYVHWQTRRNSWQVQQHITEQSKWKPVDVQSVPIMTMVSMIDPKFNLGDHVRISKYKSNILWNKIEKGYQEKRR